MDVDSKTNEIMGQVTRRGVSEKFAHAINEAKRDRQRWGGSPDHRTNPEIIADALLFVYRAGVFDALTVARTEYEARLSDDRK